MRWTAKIDCTSIPLRCFIGTLAVFVLFNLPYRYRECAFTTLGENHDYTANLVALSNEPRDAIFGGWPLQYAASPLPDAAATNATFAYLPWSGSWSPFALSVNLLIALATASIVAGLIAFASRLAVAVACGAAAVLILGVAHQGVGDRMVAERLAEHATVYRSALVPGWIARVVPSFGLHLCARTRGVVLHRCNDAAIAQAVRLPALDSLGFRGDLPSSAQLHPLVKHPRLRELKVINGNLAGPLSDVIAQQRGLRRLQLIGCRNIAGVLKELEGLAHLQSFDAYGSDFPLAALSGARWCQRLKRLRLSAPASGPDTLTLCDCDHLEMLTLGHRDDQFNDAVLAIKLENLPRLRVLVLTNTQKTDLSITDVPRLQELQVQQSENPLATTDLDQRVGLWLRRLRLSGTASLRRVSCHALELERIEIEDAPNLIELTLGSCFGHPHWLASQTLSRSGDLSQLIDDLAQCDGPRIIDLSGLPLQGLDLTPLTKNTRIRELRLTGTGVDGDQIRPLLQLPRLFSLDVRDCPVAAADIVEILQTRPQLKKFQVQGADLEQLEIVDLPRLTHFTSQSLANVATVRIAGSPNLAAELILGAHVRELSIRDAWSLRGISVNGPLPLDATLEGLRDLRFCALAGPTVRDRLCKELWHCTQLEQLTLAYCNLSRQALMHVGDLHQLNTLILPGCDIDDELTLQWTDLRQLREIDLSHTRISTGTLNFLLSRRDLQRLAINHIDVQKADLRGLTELIQLIELEVAGIGLDEQTLSSLLARRMLDRLDISDTRLTPGVLAILTTERAGRLLSLGIRNCGLSEAAVRSILEANPELAVDVRGNPLSEAFIDELRESNRLLRCCDREGFLRRVQAGRAAVAEDIPPVATVDTVRGRIDVHQFARETVSVASW